jgi:hypothetical protein
MTYAYRILIGRPKGRRPCVTSGHRLEDNFKMYVKEEGREIVDWIQGAQDRNLCWAVVNTIQKVTS